MRFPHYIGLKVRILEAENWFLSRSKENFVLFFAEELKEIDKNGVGKSSFSNSLTRRAKGYGVLLPVPRQCGFKLRLSDYAKEVLKTNEG